jgi:nucleotide-binding universal stress UspA family protein
MKDTISPTASAPPVTTGPDQPVKADAAHPSMKRLKSILVPIDFSTCSIHALMYALAFAKEFAAELFLLAVVDHAPTTFEYDNPDYLSLIESRRAMFQQELDKLMAIEVPSQIVARAIARAGRAAECIVNEARQWPADLIIMSTRGVGNQNGLGSTSQRVVQYAPCPVLVLHSPERDFVATGSPSDQMRPSQQPAGRQDH